MTRRGRRDNGLDATSYVPLRDVDPRVGEHLLELLREAGIAAYLEPTSDVDSYTRAISLPSPPSDRLWVDRAARPDAYSLVVEHADADSADGSPGSTRRSARAEADQAAETSRLDEAAIWAQIVANYNRAIESPVPPWPAHEDADPAADESGPVNADEDDWDELTDADQPAPTRREVAAESRPPIRTTTTCPRRRHRSHTCSGPPSTPWS